MISAWHLIWLLPVAAVFGFAVCALLGANREAELTATMETYKKLCFVRKERIEVQEGLINAQKNEIEILKAAIDTFFGKLSGAED